MIWAGKSEPKCNLTSCHDFDLSFCQCQTCNTTFWSSYEPLFCGDMIDNMDLADGAIVVSDESAAVSDDTLIAAVSDGTPIAATAEITLVSRESSAANIDTDTDAKCLFDSVTYSSIFSAVYKCDNAVIDTANDANLL